MDQLIEEIADRTSAAYHDGGEETIPGAFDVVMQRDFPCIDPESVRSAVMSNLSQRRIYTVHQGSIKRGSTARATLCALLELPYDVLFDEAQELKALRRDNSIPDLF